MQPQWCRLQVEALLLLSWKWMRDGWLGLLGHHSKVTEIHNLTETVIFFLGVGAWQGEAQWYSMELHWLWKPLFVSLDLPHLTSFQLVFPGSQHPFPDTFLLLDNHFSPMNNLFPHIQSLSHGQPLELNFMINVASLVSGMCWLVNPKWTPRFPWVLPYHSCSSGRELSRENYPPSSSKQTGDFFLNQ